MVAEHLHKDYPYLSNVNFDPRSLGFQAGFVPFLQGITSARIDMWAGHLNQAMVLDGAEHPQIFSGSEKDLGQYEFTKTRRNQDIRVIACIPKYCYIHGDNNSIRNNPTLTVVYEGLDDHLIHYMDVEGYTKGSDGYGYQNVFVNTHRLQPGAHIDKDVVLVTSPNHKNGLYCFGINANIAYMTMEETIEDAMMVSQSFADKAMTTELHKKTITIYANQHPLNSYGDQYNYKLFPDIGEYVNDDGTLMILRPISADTFISDTMSETLNTRQDLHDEIYYAPPGALIVDVDVVVTKNAKIPKTLYSQIDKYNQANIKYWQEIINVYNEHHKFGIAPEFHTLVSNSIQRLVASGSTVRLPKSIQKKSKIALIGKNKRPIEFMQISITYATKRKCNNGFKGCGRDGARQ